MERHPVILSIAGSDCSGGAGIQADIKTISALGGYAASAITAVTVQNTLGVRAVHAIPRNCLRTNRSGDGGFAACLCENRHGQRYSDRSCHR